MGVGRMKLSVGCCVADECIESTYRRAYTEVSDHFTLMVRNKDEKEMAWIGLSRQ